MDAADQMAAVASSSVPVVIQLLLQAGVKSPEMLILIAKFQSNVTSRATHLLNDLRKVYLSGERGPTPASSYLGKTKVVYEYIRVGLGVRMHGLDNITDFKTDAHSRDATIGQSISVIYEVSISIHVSCSETY